MVRSLIRALKLRVLRSVSGWPEWWANTIPPDSLPRENGEVVKNRYYYEAVAGVLGNKPLLNEIMEREIWYEKQIRRAMLEEDPRAVRELQIEQRGFRQMNVIIAMAHNTLLEIKQREGR